MKHFWGTRVHCCASALLSCCQQPPGWPCPAQSIILHPQPRQICCATATSPRTKPSRQPHKKQVTFHSSCTGVWQCALFPLLLNEALPSAVLDIVHWHAVALVSCCLHRCCALLFGTHMCYSGRFPSLAVGLYQCLSLCTCCKHRDTAPGMPRQETWEIIAGSAGS